ncbi:FecR domain-containing protein [Duganella sp. sic0402]|uniref:FecR family protein n=1 Tax=Duganella sp. sic0402 TaxID=2854786 RepID=UPI001C4441F5|nr:FecR domain-containing protein [Duganella sp. sic0402]MBV7534971.1 FecR domain-containing protein [Duganella sp. sic0402]
MKQAADQIAMREADAFLRAQSPVDLAAVEWHTRAEQGLSNEEDAQFQQWLAADPAHAAAFEHLNASLRDVRALPVERIAHLRRAAPSRQRVRQGWRERLSARMALRPAALAFACVALLAVGAGWKLWQAMPAFSASYASERGQRRDITLPDGSQLTLDTSTRVEVALYRDRREVRLSHGQAMFSVAHDTAKPFSVLAGTARVTVLGTRFSVRCNACQQGATDVNVEVEQGHVHVAAPPRVAELRAGQAVQVYAAGGLGAVASINPASIAPWRKGLIRFTSTPLAEALREFERYAPVKLLIRDPEIAAMPIGGSYQVLHPAAFVQVLPHIMPVQLIQRPDGLTEVVRKN